MDCHISYCRNLEVGFVTLCMLDAPYAKFYPFRRALPGLPHIAAECTRIFLCLACVSSVPRILGVLCYIH